MLENESRVQLAKKVAESLLEDLESGEKSISEILFKAKRLARLLRDSDAQLWLDYELRGYPDKFHIDKLGNCKKYAIQGGRIHGESQNQYYLPSLPEFEAMVKTSEIQLSAIKFPANFSPSLSSSNQYENTGFSLKNAVNSMTQSYSNLMNNATLTNIQYTKLFHSIKSSIHNYVTDVHIALSVGEIAQDIFEEARELVDNFIRVNCPRASEQILIVQERMQESDPEAFSQALTTCRRIMLAVADSIFSPQTEPYIDKTGQERKVGAEEYKNRLMAYIEQNTESNTSVELQESALEHLSARLDTVNEKVCKGVHADVTKEEARLIVIHTYLFLAEVAKIANKKIKDNQLVA